MAGKMRFIVRHPVSMREQEIFTTALNYADSAACARFLDEACGPDADLRRRLDELLQCHLTSDSVLDRRPIELLVSLEARGDAADDHSADSEEAIRQQLQPYLETPSHPDALGRLGHYELLQILGQGGFGVVVKAVDTRLERQVAIKILAPHLAVTSPPRRRFLREARAAAGVRHEHVVQTYAVDDAPIPHMVMEFIAGESLQDRIDRLGPFEPEEVVRLGLQIARGLSAAHEKGLIHRDIKPGNILIEEGIEPRAKLSDFGLAQTADDANQSQSGAVIGTPMYMSPEQVRGEEVDQRTDLFSFGSVLYLMTTGRPPFRAPTTLTVLKRVAEDTPRSPCDVIPGTPAGLCEVIARLHAKSRDERYATAQEVIAALETCLTTPPSKLRRRASDRAASSVWKRSIAAVAALVTVCCIISESAGWTNIGSRLREAGQGLLPTAYVRTDNQSNVGGQSASTEAASVRSTEPVAASEPPAISQTGSSETGFIVTSLLDDGSNGTLRWAVTEANLHHGEDTITFDPAMFSEPETITLTQGPLILIDPALTTITGPAAGLTISGNNRSQVFVIGADGGVSDRAARVQISDLTIAQGRTNEEFKIGGGVLVHGGATLTLIGCMLRDNAAPIENTGGGAIFVGDSTLVMTNCTLTRNEADDGGAVKNYAGVVKATNCTFVGNSARVGGGIYSNGFYKARTEVNNCLFENTSGGNLYLFDGLEHTGDYNLSSDGSAPGSHSIHHTTATLGPLGRYGGPTETYPLLTGSPALNAGSNSLLPENYPCDQRGLPRIVQGQVDIGAFEAQ